MVDFRRPIMTPSSFRQRFVGAALLAWAVVAALTVLEDASAHAAGLAYVDADDGVNGAGNLSLLANIDVNQSVSNDGLWGYRSDGGVNGPGAVFRSVYEASGGATAEDAAQITQTLSGLGGNTSYDVYVVYWQGAQGNFDWNVRAGFTPGAMTLFNASGPSTLMPDGIAGAIAGYHEWDAPPLSIAGSSMFSEAGRTLLLGKVGTATSSPAGEIAVVIDDLPATLEGAGSSAHRSWFDGLAYVPAGTTVFHEGGDFNRSGGIDSADATILLQNIHADTSSMPITQTYELGDISLEGAINHTDFVRFKAIYNAANGEGAFEAFVASVPEPSTWALLSGSAAILLILKMHPRRGVRQLTYQRAATMKATSLKLMGIGLIWAAANVDSAHAAPVAGWQLVASNDGSPSSKQLTGADANSPAVGDGTDGNAGQTALYADLNGTFDGAADIALANGQRVTLTGSANLLGITPSMEQFRWGLFFEDAAPFDAKAWQGYFATNSTTNSGGALRAKDTSLSAFADALFVANGGTASLGSARDSEAFNAGAYNFSMTISRFGNELSIDASLTDGADFLQEWQNFVVANPTQQTFNFNRAGFLLGNNMSPDQVAFSNIDVTVEPVDALVLQVTTTGPNAGKMRVVNPTGESIVLDYYEITSAAGSLNPAGWVSFDDQEGGDPPLQGWDEAPNSDANILSEIHLQDSATMGAGAARSLGNAFNTIGAPDLIFAYGLPGSENLARGIVEFGVFAQPGDFDGDGDVDGADLNQWRGDFGVDAQSDADGDGDTDGSDFLVWQQNLSAGLASPAAAAVPEPAAALLLMAAVWAVRSSRPRLRRQ